MKRIIFSLIGVAVLIFMALPAASPSPVAATQLTTVLQDNFGNYQSTVDGGTPHLDIAKSASPDPNCGEAQVTLNVTGAGEPGLERLPVDVMLIIDVSWSMTRDKIGAAKGAATAFIALLDSSQDRVGLVSYSNNATLNAGLPDDFDAVQTAINGLSANRYTNISDAIDTANQELTTHGRSPGVVWVEILLTDGLPNRWGHSPVQGSGAAYSPTAAQYARDAAQAAHNAGITLYTIGLGSSTNPVYGISKYFLDELLASEHTYNPGDPAEPYTEEGKDGLARIGGGHYYYAPTGEDLNFIFLDISQKITTIAGTEVVVTEVLPEGVNYADNAVPTGPDEISPDGQTLTWNLGLISIGDTWTVTFDVTFDNPGYQLVDVFHDPPTEGAKVTYTDYLGNPNQEIAFPKTYIRVLQPVADAGDDVSIHSGGSTELDGSGSEILGGCEDVGGHIEYQWSIKDGALIQSWPADPTVPVSPTVTTTYTLEVRCSALPDCTDSDDVVVTICVPPTVNITPDSGELTCATTFIILTADTTETCEVISYQWYKDGSPLGETSNTLTVTEDGTYKVEVECANGCKDEDSVTVTKDTAVPTVNVANVEVCEGETATLTATVSGCTVKSYQWYKGASSSGTLIPGATSETYSIPNASAADAGAYACLVECETGCKSEDSGTLTVNPSPTANFTADKTSGCAPLTVVFTDASTGSPTSRSWSFPGGSPSSATGKGPHTVTYNSPGTYTVSLTVSNACGSDTETKENYITSSVCEECGAIAPDFSICVDTPLDDALFISHGAGCSGTSGCTMTDLDYSGVDSSEPGTYGYTVTCSDGVSPDMDTGTVTVLPAPTADFTADKTSGCAPLTVQFTDASTGSPTSRSWDFGDGDTSTAQNPSHTYTSAGTYTVSLTVSNACGSDTETKTGYITAEDCGPVIIKVEQIPEGPYYCAGEDVTIRAHVTDDVGVTSVTLTYGTKTVSMTPVSGDAQDGYWEAKILGRKAGDTLTIVVTATDGDGNTVSSTPHDITWIDCAGRPSLEVSPGDAEPCEGEDVTVSATATSGGSGIKSVTIYVDGTPHSMTHVSGDLYQYSISGSGKVHGDTVDYYVVAEDNNDNTTRKPVSDSYTITWIECAGRPSLTIIKTDSPDPIWPGQNITYAITVTNTGSVAATGVTITDDYDQSILTIVDVGGGVSIISDPPDTITWDGGITIPAGGSFSCNITATLSSTARRGSTFYNSANVTCAEEVSAFDIEVTTIAGARPGGGGGSGGGGGAPLKYLTVDWEHEVTKKPLDDDDRLTQTLLGPSPDGRHSLELKKGTLAPTTPDGKRHYLITIRELDEVPPLPENTIVAGGVAYNIIPDEAVFDREIFLTLGFNPLALSENTISATMAYYDAVSGVWVPVESTQGGVAELGTMSAAITHFTPFAILVTLAPPPPPAHFVASGLSIMTSVEKIWEPITFVTKTGESATIAASIANDGGQEGTYDVKLKLNGETVDSETVTLGAGESQQVSFTLSGLNYGQYEVELAGLRGEFTVSRTIIWWLIICIIVVIGLISWGVVWGRRRRRAT